MLPTNYLQIIYLIEVQCAFGNKITQKIWCAIKHNQPYNCVQNNSWATIKKCKYERTIKTIHWPQDIK